MIKALIKAAGQIIRNPFVIIPAIIFSFILAFFIDAVFMTIMEVIYRAFVLLEFPDVPTVELPFHLIGKYFMNLVSLVVLGSIINAGAAMVFFAYTHYSKKGKGITESLFYAIGRISDAIALAVFVLIVLTLYSAILWIAYLLFSIGGLEIIAILLILLVLLLGFYLAVKLYFVPVVMAAEEIRLKEAIAKTWLWSQKRFFGALAMLAVVNLVWIVITSLTFGFVFAFEDPVLYMTAFIIISSIASAYSVLAMANYYLG